MEADHDANIKKVHQLTEELIPLALKAIGSLILRFPTHADELKCSAMEGCYLCVRTIILSGKSVESIERFACRGAINASIDYLRSCRAVRVPTKVFKKDPNAYCSIHDETPIEVDHHYIDYDDLKKYYSLTDREMTVARMLAAGYSVTEVGDKLNMHKGTVSKARKSARLKVEKKQ